MSATCHWDVKMVTLPLRSTGFAKIEGAARMATRPALRRKVNIFYLKWYELRVFHTLEQKVKVAMAGREYI